MLDTFSDHGHPHLTRTTMDSSPANLMMTEIGMEPNRRRHRPKVINHYARQLNLKQSLHSLRLLNYGFVHVQRQVKITPGLVSNEWSENFIFYRDIHDFFLTI